MAPYYTVSPWDGVKAKLKKSTKLDFTIGCYSHKELPLVSDQFTIHSCPNSPKGLTFRAFNEPPEEKGRMAVDEILLTKHIQYANGLQDPSS